MILVRKTLSVYPEYCTTEANPGFWVENENARVIVILNTVRRGIWARGTQRQMKWF